MANKERAFTVTSYVLKHTMNGQQWAEGNAEYHEWISVPTLLLHGRQDRLISLAEAEDMLDVSEFMAPASFPLANSTTNLNMPPPNTAPY